MINLIEWQLLLNFLKLDFQVWILKPMWQILHDLQLCSSDFLTNQSVQANSPNNCVHADPILLTSGEGAESLE